MEASKLRELRDLANSLPDPRLGVIIQKANFVELLDYVSLLEAQYSDLMFECSALHEERRAWWNREKRTPALKTPEPDHGTLVVDLPAKRFDEDYLTGFGQKLKVHRLADCTSNDDLNAFCVIHKPMPGPWSLWPTYWRSDAGFMERICPHGVGHPVVESLGHDKGRGIGHGCCGCPCALKYADRG